MELFQNRLGVSANDVRLKDATVWDVQCAIRYPCGIPTPLQYLASTLPLHGLLF